MKDGFRYPGASVEVSAGSFGRTEVSADAGGNNGSLGASRASKASTTSGWRDHSSTRIRRLYARADLPDAEPTTSNVGAHARRQSPRRHAGAARVDARRIRSRPTRGPTPPTTGSASSTATGTHLRFRDDSSPPTPTTASSRPAASTATSTATTRRPAIRTRRSTSSPTRPPGRGARRCRLTLQRAWGATRHQIVVGAAFDAGSTDFTQSAQPATFVGDRDTVGVGPFVPRHDGRRRTNRYAGVYVADTIALDAAMDARRCRVATTRRGSRRRTAPAKRRRSTAPTRSGASIPPSARRGPEATGVNVFGGVSQGMRVPSPVELTCADPNAPCTLPNIFVADPPLQAGARDDLRGRRSRQRRRDRLLQRRAVPDRSRRRHPVHQRGQRRGQRRLFPERRQDPPPGRRAHRRRRLRDRSGSSRATACSTRRSRRRSRKAARTTSPRMPTATSRSQPGNTMPLMPRHTRTRARRLDSGTVRDRRHRARRQLAVRARQRKQRRSRRQGARLCRRRRSMRAGRSTPEWQLFARIDNLFNRRLSEFRHSRRQLFPRARWHIRRRRSPDPNRSGRPQLRSARGSEFNTGSTARTEAVRVAAAHIPPFAAMTITSPARRRLLRHLGVLGAGALGTFAPARIVAESEGGRGADADLCRTPSRFDSPLLVPRTDGLRAAYP